MLKQSWILIQQNQTTFKTNLKKVHLNFYRIRPYFQITHHILQHYDIFSPTEISVIYDNLNLVSVKLLVLAFQIAQSSFISTSSFNKPASSLTNSFQQIVFLWSCYYLFFIMMRKTVSLLPEPHHTEQQRRSTYQKYTLASQQSKGPIHLSEYMKMRKSSKKQYESKQDLKEQKMETILKQRSVTRVGNLIQQQLKQRKKLLESADINQITREEIFMEELLNVLIKGNSFEKFASQFNVGKNSPKSNNQLGKHEKNSYRPQFAKTKQIKSQTSSPFKKQIQVLKHKPEVKAEVKKQVKFQQTIPPPSPHLPLPSPSSQLLKPGPQIQRARARKFTFQLNIDLINSPN